MKVLRVKLASINLLRVVIKKENVKHYKVRLKKHTCTLSIY